MRSTKLSLVKKANIALKDSLKNCRICPRRCGVDRTSGKTGYCRAPYNPIIYSHLPHHGEEPPISGIKGSGAIFFSNCNMKCVYCQNYYFSQLDKGEETTIDRLADIMIGLQRKGCHNINLVTPTHYLSQILMSLEMALENGLDIPIVYNTSGYELEETIRLLDGIVDIYLPDMRYADDAEAKKYSDADRYVEFNRMAVIRMHRQAGDLEMDGSGIAKKGTIIRLLALPNSIAGTGENLRFIRNKLGRNTYLSIMSQYYPTFKACGFSEISLRILPEEYKNIVDEARRLELNNGWIQKEPEETDPKFLGTNLTPE